MKNNTKIFFILFIAILNMGIAKTPYSGKTIKIAVIDTGFDFSSNWEKAGVDSDGIRLRKPKLCKYGHKDFTNTGIKDNHGHGTHVAGIIAKFAEDANYCLVIIKYHDPTAIGLNNLSNTIKAFEYASNLDVDMINYSGGGVDFFPSEYRSIKKSLDKGVIMVMAAGNEESENNYRIFKVDEKNNKVYYIDTTTGHIINRKPTGYYPADYDPRIIAVGNSFFDKKDGKVKVAPSSNHGNAINFQENGTNILSILPNNKRGYMTGTSQAAPTRLGKMVKMWGSK